MSEREDQLGKTLHENGSYDAEKAKRAGETAVAQYASGLKKTERMLWIYLLVCVVIAVLAFDGFMFSADNKALLGCGIAFLVAVETTILMKLWYWIVNVKLTLQKEIRQGQVQAAGPESTAYAPSWLGEMSFGRPGLSPWERRAWLVALILAAVATSSYASYSHATTPNLLTLSESVRLAPDGTSSSTMHVAYQLRAVSAESFPLQTGCLEGTIRWLDERGRPLPFDAVTQDGQRRYTVYLMEPLYMGQWLRYTQIREIPQYATRESDLWTYQNDLTYGCGKNRFFITVELPRGAKVVSAEPQPVEQSSDDGIPKLVFSAARGSNERFQCKIQYQFAGKTAAEKKPAQ